MSKNDQELKETENVVNNNNDNSQQASANDDTKEKETGVVDDNAETETDKLAAALAEIDSLKDKYLRQVAEFDNYRKRTLKEKTDLILNGGEKVLSALLPVLDDLDRAMQNIEKSTDVETLKEGVSLIMDKLTKTLQGQGLQKMDAIGKMFDTDFHEAVALIPSTEEAQKNHVIDCVQPGYMLNEKVIRHAKVVVGQ